MPGFDIDPATWATLNRLLDQLLDLPLGERSRRLDELGPEHAALRPRLAKMLASIGDDGPRPLDTLPKLAGAGTADAEDVDDEAEAEGSTLGPYRLTRLLAQGGMGAVWLAERHDGIVQRPVALKLPHGSWASAGLWERMAREREILASLNHPHIARLYDAGLGPGGQPFLALEYVEGQPIDAYVAETNLDLRARLRLFLQVAAAVAHAHGQLVVHRDLKPSNILVTRDGEVKLLDFGIAKLLEQGAAQQTALTEAAGRALTLSYASPEQVRGEPIGVASDVYSLSVVLFELLTKVHPYRAASGSRPGLEAAILESDPPRPSDVAMEPSARKALRGDLDTVVLKGLKKSPDERYPTVNALADDIERHLSGHPVVARPDTAAYRIGKFVRRHAVAVAAGCVMVVALLAATGITAWQMLEARRQRDTAIYEQRRAQATNEFFGAVLDDTGAERVTPIELLNRGVRLLEEHAAQEPAYIGRTYLEIAHRYADLGQPELAFDLEARAEAAARRLNDAGLLAAALCSAAPSAQLLKDRERLRGRLAEARALLASIPEPSLDDRIRCQLAEALLTEADGDQERAIELLRSARGVIEASPASNTRLLAIVLNNLSYIHFKRNALDESLALNEEVLALLERTGLGNTLGRSVLELNQASLLEAVGELSAGIDARRRVLERLKAREGPAEILAEPLMNYGVTLVQASWFDEARSVLTEARARASAAGNIKVTALADLSLGRVDVLSGRFEAGEASLRAAETVLSRSPEAFAGQLTGIELVRIVAAISQGRVDEARTRIESVLAAQGYPGRSTSRLLRPALHVAARVALAAGDYRRAEELSSDLLRVAERVARNPSASAHVGEALLFRAQARLGTADEAGARADLERAVPSLESGFGPAHPSTRQALALLEELSRSP
jgi:serine/threonine-protein kinase